MESSEHFIHRIKAENIKPIPKWRFRAKNGMLWSLVLLSIVIGAISFSIILFVIQQIEFNLISHMSHSRLEMWLALLPFLWIIMLIVFIMVSIFGLKKTRKGYKFPVSRVVGGNVIFSILLGTILFLGGGAGWLENTFEAQMDFYQGVEEMKEKIWSVPNEGYLSGTITELGETNIRITDHHNNSWLIDIKDANIFTLVEMEKGERIKLVGTVTGDGTFAASEVRPWGGFGRGGPRHGQPRKGSG